MTAIRGMAGLAMAAAFCSAMGAPSARAGSQDGLTGYADLRFGLTLPEASTLTGAAPSRAGDGSELIESEQMVAGRLALRQLWFRDGRLSRIVFRWSAEDHANPERCRAMFDRLADLVAQRYSRPAQGPTAQEGRRSFSGGAFWAFADGASIGLSVSYAPDEAGPKSCRAMLSYREPPGD